MRSKKSDETDPASIFNRAEWYDRGINWTARLDREIPVLTEVFGPPGEGGILDAGCGPGRQASALAKMGYRVTGADASEDMLSIARRDASGGGPNYVLARYDQISEQVADGFDGIYCLGNALAAAGSRDAVRDALAQFSRCLRDRGRLFFQVLNFPRMRTEQPCTRGPRVASVDGVDYISVRHFHFGEDVCQVTNVTLFNADAWTMRSHSGTLYPVTIDELREWADEFSLRIDDLWGSYKREPFTADQSPEVLLFATRV